MLDANPAFSPFRMEREMEAIPFILSSNRFLPFCCNLFEKLNVLHDGAQKDGWLCKGKP